LWLFPSACLPVSCAGRTRSSRRLPRPRTSLERLGLVASLAAATERALMDVIRSMAAVAPGLQRDLLDVLRGVAGVAIEPAMRPGQRIFGLGIVIEAPARPAIRIVAKRAILAQPSLMMLILVAARAGKRRALVGRRSVALLAWHDGVT